VKLVQEFIGLSHDQINILRFLYLNARSYLIICGNCFKRYSVIILITDKLQLFGLNLRIINWHNAMRHQCIVIIVMLISAVIRSQTPILTLILVWISHWRILMN
jgi:hypothetical protein